MIHSNSKKYWLGFFLIIGLPLLCIAQDQGTDDSFWKDLTAAFTIATTIIAGLISLIVAVVTTRSRVKAEVEKLVKEKTMAYVDTFFTKELDLDADTAKAFFRKLKADAEKVKSTQVWIVNHPSDGDRKSLFEAILNAGFAAPKPIVVTKEEIALQAGALVIFDASQELTESQIVAFGGPLQAQAYFFFYGERYGSSNLLKMRGYANTPDTLVKRLKEVVLD